MKDWTRAEAEIAIAYLRAQINAHLEYKKAYDAEAHNACVARVLYKDGSISVLAAYSEDSAVSYSTRLALHLVPDVSRLLPAGEKFGCNGMAQYHTEPKLLNFLLAPPQARRQAYGPAPQPNTIYRSILSAQIRQAHTEASLLKGLDDAERIDLVTEINCCKTCCKYAIEQCTNRHRVIVHPIELGKGVKQGTPPTFEIITVKKNKP